MQESICEMSKLAIVTGATGGLGGAIVKELVLAGYEVIACGRDAEKMVALARESPCIIPRIFDLTLPEEITWAMEVELHMRKPDVLVCAHGATPCTAPSLSLTKENIMTIWHTDVMGAFLMSQVVGARMVQQKHGSIVLVSSAHAHATYPSRVPYVLAKSAIVGMARALAVEWGPYNVRVNAVTPWQCTGERSDAVAAHELATSGVDTLELYRQRSPLRRLVTPEDVAKAVLFCAENESMSGQEVRLDCGVGASMWHRPFAG